MSIKSQLEAGMDRHNAKPFIPGKVIYQDDRITQVLHERRDGNSIVQFNNIRNRSVAIIVARKP